MNLQIIQQQLANIQSYLNNLDANSKKPWDFTELDNIQDSDIALVSRGTTVYKTPLSSLFNAKDKVINIGAMTLETINEHINANDSTEWNLQKNTTYYFEALKDGLLYRWLYVGDKPKYLGQSQQANAQASDFVLWSVSYFFIQAGNSYAYVKKGSGNTNQTTQEIGDEVFNKQLSGGEFLLAHTYSSSNGASPFENIENYTLKNLDL